VNIFPSIHALLAALRKTIACRSCWSNATSKSSRGSTYPPLHPLLSTNHLYSVLTKVTTITDAVLFGHRRWAYNKNNHEMLAASTRFLETLNNKQYRAVLQKKTGRDFVISSVNAMKMFRRRKGESPLKVGVSVDRADVVKYLLAHGENVNQTDENDETVLHYSAAINSKNSCKLFIEAGADVNLISKSGYSPLHLASENGASDIVELLLSHKAVADVPNHNGQTALHVLAMSWDNNSSSHHNTLTLVDRLLSHKANAVRPVTHESYCIGMGMKRK